MINERVFQTVSNIRSEFLASKPFHHVCVDGFLDERTAEILLRDFPKFKPDHAIDEVGSRYMISDIKSIAVSYALLYDYLSSKEFLQAVSRMTGIAALNFDPLLSGAGTVENREGAEIDPHVDYNFDSRTGWHRRLNLMLHLNKEWSEEWGGAVELHSDPLGGNDSSNVLKSYNSVFNRCVIFETSERSWWGFRKIRLPAEKISCSTKLISIFLYTENRSKDEIVPPHRTFFVPNLERDSIRPNKILTLDEYEELRQIRKKWTSMLAIGFEAEKQLSGRYHDLLAYVRLLEMSLSPPLLGFGRVRAGTVKGYFPDRWVAPQFELTIEPQRPVTSATIHGWLPDGYESDIEVIAGAVSYKAPLCNGKFQIAITFENSAVEPFQVVAKASPFSGGTAKDRRVLGFVLDSIRLGH